MRKAQIQLKFQQLLQTCNSWTAEDLQIGKTSPSHLPMQVLYDAVVDMIVLGMSLWGDRNIETYSLWDVHWACPLEGLPRLGWCWWPWWTILSHWLEEPRELCVCVHVCVHDMMWVYIIHNTRSCYNNVHKKYYARACKKKNCVMCATAKGHQSAELHVVSEYHGLATYLRHALPALTTRWCT